MSRKFEPGENGCKRPAFWVPLITVKQLAVHSRKQTVGRREDTVVRTAKWTNPLAAGCPSQGGAGGFWGQGRGFNAQLRHSKTPWIMSIYVFDVWRTFGS